MSEALDYLARVRPDAMGAYFAFLRHAGSHLDPKTRALISVITKVAAQTDQGFRRYLQRALDQGASADEILDALLVAFPVLGLTRLTWAVDRLLEMDLPVFRPERLLPDGRWRRLGPVADFADGRAAHVDTGDGGVFVYRHGDEIAVYDPHCPHHGTRMSDGDRRGCALQCPQHGWEFDLRTGACVSGAQAALRRLSHRIESGVLYAQW